MKQIRSLDVPIKLNGAREDSLPYALVLAGGEGKRLRPFVHLLRQDLLPKQYVNFIGRRSMLEHTLDRAEQLAPAAHVFTIVNKHHLVFPDARRQIAKRSNGTVIVQPENKETTAGILLALMHIAKRNPNSIVTVLPSDHFVLEEDELVSYLKFAHDLVKRNSSRIVLLGIAPECEESEYGYIVTGRRLRQGANFLFRISSFVEKPNCDTAQKLVRSGALWNTMMMVFKTSTLLDAISVLAPVIFDAFRPIYEAIGSPDEEAVTETIYQQLPESNFSKEILEPLANDDSASLVTVPVRNILWSDWGSENRVMEVLRKIGYASRLNNLTRSRAPIGEPTHGERLPAAGAGKRAVQPERIEMESRGSL
jgi:mannose-1-phosphate guanylyltransferase